MDTGAHQVDTRSDLLGLKTTLEVEILEQVSREVALKRNLEYAIFYLGHSEK